MIVVAIVTMIIILTNAITFCLQIGWIFAFLVIISFWNEEIKMIVMCVQFIGIVIQLFCLWCIEKRIKYWTDLREEVVDLYTKNFLIDHRDEWERLWKKIENGRENTEDKLD